MVDQLKATALNLYGNSFCETPALEKLAEEGVLFENAQTPHPLCVPARISTWTSQYPHTHGSRRNETLMPENANHAFKIWKEAGYYTALIGKNHCFQSEDMDYFDTWCEIGHFGLPEHVQSKGMEWVRPVDKVHEAHTVRRDMPVVNPRMNYAITDYPEEDYSTALVSQQTIKFLGNHREDPFSLWLSIPDPHNPYEVPRRYAEMFPKEKIELPPWVKDEMNNQPERNQVLYEMLGIDQQSEEDVYQLLGIYYGMVRFIDDELGKIFNALDNLGLRENTIVVFCSDHGDFVGEHRMMGKGGVFYDCLTHVPFIMSWPSKIQQGIRDNSMVSLIDIVPTLFHLQGIEVPRSMQGKLLPTVTNEKPRDEIFSEYGAGGVPFTLNDLETFEKPYGRHTIKQTLKWREAEGRRKMVRTRDWKYITDPMGDKDELYDLKNDPWELRNVVEDIANKEIIADLTKRLFKWSVMTEDAKPVPLPNMEES